MVRLRDSWPFSLSAAPTVGTPCRPLQPESVSELMHRPERARRLEVFTGAGRRRTWPADEKAAIAAESYAPGRTVCGVARRHGLTPAQLFTWRRLARRSRRPKAPALFVPAVVEPSPGP